MKKIISVLFFLCFLNVNHVIAQGGILKRFSTIHTPVPKRVSRPVPDTRHLKLYEPNTRHLVPNAPPIKLYVPHPVLEMPSVPIGLSEGSLRPSKLISIDVENRGFIQERHVSSPSERLCPTIGNQNVPLYSPSNINTHTSPPKVNMDKLRMKVMKCQNRLNKNEMRVDEFIFIGLLINRNEYGEYYVTNYAA